jgi:hypothetical protein
MKDCNKCLCSKPESYFHRDASKKDGLRTICIECNKVGKKNWNRENPERKTKRNKEWIKKNPERYKANQLRIKFGITLEQYNELFTAQNGGCAICRANGPELKRQLSVDHCHATGKIRGLLCDTCNVGLGYFKDNQNLLAKAIAYLEGK